MGNPLENISHKVLWEAEKRFNIQSGSSRPLGRTMNYVFECMVQGIPRILRITHSAHTDYAMICGELEFIEHLYSRGVPVCRALLSQAGKLVELIQTHQDYFSAVLLEKARGKSVEKQDLNEALIFNWGATVGQIHSATKDFIPSNPVYKRKEWDEFEYLKAKKHVPEGEWEVLQKWEALMGEFHSFPRNKACYGLIHCDVAPKNFFVGGNHGIHLFDFDECQYQWFVYDIAFSLFTGAWKNVSAAQEEVKVKQFIHWFMEGYLRFNTIEARWLEKIPQFLKLQELIMYVFFCERFNGSNLTVKEKGILENYKNRIVHDVPWFNFKVF